MILLPVIERELRAAARSKATYRNRFIAAVAFIGVTVWIIADRKWMPQHQLGREVFESVSFTALVVALIAGLFSAADSISEERREGTLGLLYLTDLRSRHVVFGKLVAHSIPAFFALAVIVPILGIPFLLGGVTGAELTRTSLVLLNALWLSVTAGLLGSTLSKDDRVTRLITFFILFSAAVIGPLIGAKVMSPLWTWDTSQDESYATQKVDFWIAMAAQFTMAFVCLGFAAWRARLIWREKPKTVAQQKVADKWRAWSAGSTEERKAWRELLLEKNPALWLACRRRSRTALLWLLLGIGIVILFWIWHLENRIDPAIGLLFSVIFHSLMKVTIAFAAARGLSDEARTGGLELLLTTELSPRQLTGGVLGGLIRSFGAALAVVIVADAVWILMFRVDSFFPDGFKKFLWIRLGFLLFDSITLACYALWLGVKNQRSGRAALKALLMVIVVPDLLALLLFSRPLGISRPVEAVIACCILINVVLLIRSIGPLMKLRQKASEQFSPNSARA